MWSPLAAFQERSTPVTSGWMWRVSVYVIDPSVKVTGSFLIGCILAPFTVWGVTVDGSKLSLCSPRWVKAVSPATKRSAPESGSVLISALPFRDDMCTRTVGADSMSSEFLTFDALTCGVCPSVVGTESALVEGWVVAWEVGCRGCLLLQTLARWPIRWHRWQVWLYAGHCLRPSWWKFPPHPGQTLVGFRSVRVLRIDMIVLSVAPDISARCRFAASKLLHFEIVVAKVNSFSFGRSSTVSPSIRPLIIWSLIFFWVHASEQNLYVFASSRTATRKSSKGSPSCCVRRRKFRRSTDSSMWPSMYCCMALTISFAFPLWVSVRPRFSTIVSISRDRQSVRAWTCFAWDCLSNPDRFRYASHWVFHDLKSMPWSTCRSSFGRLPCLKTYVMSDMDSVLEILWFLWMSFRDGSMFLSCSQRHVE